MNKQQDNVGAMWGRWLSASEACPSEHSRRPRIPAGGAASSLHTRRRGSRIANVNRETSFVNSESGEIAAPRRMPWSARSHNGRNFARWKEEWK